MIRFYGQNSHGIPLITGLAADTKPVLGAMMGLFLETDTNKFYRWFDEWIEIPVGGSSAWGNITGTLSDQTDLQSALNGKSTTGHNHDSSYAAIAHTHPAVDISDSTATGRALISAASQAAARTALALGNSSTLDTGTSAGTVAAGDHTHPGGSEAFPVGSVFIAVVSTSPATLLGYGTWSAFAAGRVLIGRDSGDVDFDTAEEVGGAKTSTALLAHTHGITDGGHNHTQNAHTHTQDAHNHTQNSHTHPITSQTATTGSATSYEHGTLDTSSAETEATEVTGATTATNQTAVAVNQNTTATNNSATTGITATDSAGSGSSFSIMNPYIVVYMWKRTA